MDFTKFKFASKKIKLKSLEESYGPVIIDFLDDKKEMLVSDICMHVLFQIYDNINYHYNELVKNDFSKICDYEKDTEKKYFYDLILSDCMWINEYFNKLLEDDVTFIDQFESSKYTYRYEVEKSFNDIMNFADKLSYDEFIDSNIFKPTYLSHTQHYMLVVPIIIAHILYESETLIHKGFIRFNKNKSFTIIAERTKKQKIDKLCGLYGYTLSEENISPYKQDEYTELTYQFNDIPTRNPDAWKTFTNENEDSLI